MSDLLRIGQFAQLGRVSVKALRFYDAQGLLKPSYVDSGSGYRYYAVEQTERLAMITNLRAAGFSIKEISVLLADNPADKDLLHRVAMRRERLLESRRAIERQLSTLETLASSLSGNTHNSWSQVRLLSIEDQWVHALRGPVPGELDTVTAMFEAAESQVAQHNARLDAPPFMLMHESGLTAGTAPLEVCIPVNPDAARDIDTRVVEGSELACSVAFSGSYDQAEAAGDRLKQWLARAGLMASGPMREIYHRFGADEVGYRLPARVLARHRDEYLTELLLPVSTH